MDGNEEKEADRIIAEGEERADELAKWLVARIESISSDEDKEFLIFLLTKASGFNPAISADPKVAKVLAETCFAAGYKKRDDVAKLEALLK